MKLSYQLSLIVDNILKKQGYDRGISVFDDGFSVFSKEELERIESIELTKIDNIKGIENLVNLKELFINSIDFSKIYTGQSIKNNEFINKIKSFNFLEKLTKLETLQIKNDINITKLDVSNLKNLKKLILVHNPKLYDLQGLERLEKLEKVLIYGNKITSPIDIEKYIENTAATYPNILDISMYINAIRRDRKIAKLLSDSYLLGRTQLTFGEYVGFLELSVLTPENLCDMYTKFDIFFKKNNMYYQDELHKIAFVYNYILRNVKFAKYELQKRNDMVLSFKQQEVQIPQYLFKNLTSLHNSYIAFHFKKANCEGIVNLMNFMLNMLDVNSANVHCIDRRFNNVYINNHALLRVMYEGNWYYCDPTYNSKDSGKYFMRTLKELGQTHLFNDFEIMINKESNYDKHNGINFKK